MIDPTGNTPQGANHDHDYLQLQHHREQILSQTSRTTKHTSACHQIAANPPFKVGI
jgi:hypothetical protein